MDVIDVENGRSCCPIASALDLFGDKWTLIIVRDMITGKKRFGEFLKSPEGIPTNILTSRLKQMEVSGLVVKKLYQERPPRSEYILSPQGRKLQRILQEFCRWSNANIPDTWVPADSFMEKID